MVYPGCLNLRHGGPTSSDTGRSEVYTTSTNAREEGAGSESRETEPQERSGRLTFTAATFSVRGTIRNVVELGIVLRKLLVKTRHEKQTSRTYPIVTAVNTKLCRDAHGGAEPEDGVKRIKNHWNSSMSHEGLIKENHSLIDEREHCEDSDEHVEIDSRWISSCGLCNHVAGQCENQESHQPLEKLLIIIQPVQVRLRRRTSQPRRPIRSALDAIVDMLI